MPPPKARWSDGLRSEVEGVRVVEVARITVRRGEQEQNPRAGRDRVRTDGVVAGGGSVEPLDR